MGQHSHPPPRWRKYVLAVLTIGAGWVAGHVGPHSSNGPPPVNSLQAQSTAQRLAIDIVGVCNVNPHALTTQQCGEAAEVAVTPIRDGKDGKSGINGVNGINGVDGVNGRDGSNVKAQILKHADGAAEYCPRDGGTDLVPVFDCVNAKVVTKNSK